MNDPTFGMAVTRVAGDPVYASDHNTDARWLSLMAKVTGTVCSDGFLHGNHPVIDTATGRITPATLVGVAGGVPVYMTDELEATGTAASGTTTSLTDTALTQESKFWVGAEVLFTSGDNEGEARTVTDFDATTATLSWDEPLASPVAQGDGYIVTFFYIEDLQIDGVRHVFAASLKRPLAWPAANRLFAPVRFYARADSDKQPGEIYIGRVTVTVYGDYGIYEVDQSDGDFNIRAYGWNVHELSGSTLVADVPPGESVDATIEHDSLILFGPIAVSVVSPHTVVVKQAWEPDNFVVTVTNGGTETESILVSWSRRGRRT